MKKLISFLCAACVWQVSQAQDFNYSALNIPDSMRKNADVVLRDEYIKLTLKSASSGKFEVHDIITVLNEQGKEYLFFSSFSDKFSSLDDASISVYDAMGNKKNTYSKREMVSLNYGEGLVPEGKVTYFDVNAPSFPITVDISYTIKYKGIISLPSYTIQPAWQAVQHSVFDVEVPSSLGVRYKLLNTKLQPVISKDGGHDLYHWEVKNLVAYKSEKHSGGWDKHEPVVMLAPNKFQLDDYDGDMTSWKNFGTWINSLYASTTSLPAERKQFYQEMVKGAGSDAEKARILYKYMQQNMRYVSIQLGIGGFRPFPASFVDEKKYGDCKALSNYLRSALDAVGVKSNVVIIQGDVRPRNVMADFPANYFNHVILNIPGPKDTLWLECTSTTLPFGELGPFTENRRAMMITDNGGVLVNTPASNFRSNSESYVTNISLEEEGGGKVTAVYSAKGQQKDILLMRFHDMNADEKRKFLITENEWKQPDIIDIVSTPRNSEWYGFTAKMEYEKIYSFKTGSKYFFSPRLYPFFDEEIPETEKRVNDYYFDYPYQSADTTVYHFPAGFSPETLPTAKRVERPFGAYSCTYQWDADKRELTTTALLQIKERMVKAANYADLIDFKKQVSASVNEKIVMKKE